MFWISTHSNPEDPTSGDVPGRTPEEVFSSALRETRKRKGWTQQQLADQVSKLGLPFDRATIAKIETQKRRVLLDEAIALAVALGVPPSVLVLGRRGSVWIRVAPHAATISQNAFDWWNGVLPLGVPQGQPRRDAVGEPFIEDSEEERFYFDARPDFEEAADRRLTGVLHLRALAATIVNMAAFGDKLKDVRGPLLTLRQQLETLGLIVESHDDIERGKKLRTKRRHPPT